VLLDPGAIVANMHRAIQHRGFFEAKYAVFMTGPSATADIEGVLIHGAQGIRTMTVIRCLRAHRVASLFQPRTSAMSLIPKDITPVYKATIGKGTSAARWQRPVYVDLLPPCNHACPAGENIQAWLDLAQAGRYEEPGRSTWRETRFRARTAALLSPVREQVQPPVSRSAGVDPFARSFSGRPR
jgi:hypothetical protein